MTKNQQLLNESFDEIKSELLCSTLGELSEKYNVSRDIITTFIKSNSDLYIIFKSEERQKKLYENRKLHKKKFKDNRINIRLFTKRLNEEGVVRLAESVIKLAVKERDRYFFKSGRYEFWEQFTTNRKSAEYYLNLMGR